jgi:CheY-like chemotaxis protein
VKLYLPRSDQSEDIVADVSLGPVAGGTETILVAEDDEEVRATVVETLSDLGYRVLKAKDAASALMVIDSGIPIDLLFTDVVMPGSLKSPELSRKARERIPNIAVLFTSGYTENAIVHGGRLDAGVELLSKPYSREALARKLRHVLANRAQRAAVAEAKPVEGAPIAKEKPLAVLLVEDDPIIRMTTSEILQEIGHAVVETGSAEEALIALQAKTVDVIVTDLGLPGISGADFAVQARRLRPDIGIIIATGMGEAPASVGEGTVLLRKPYDEDALAKALQAVRHKSR